MTITSVILRSTLHSASHKDCVGLSSLIRISLPGNLPTSDSNHHVVVPIEISVSVPKEVVGDLVPVLEFLPVFPTQDPNITNIYSPSEPDHSIPFLPLGSDFGHLDRDCWAKLTKSIQDWLLSGVRDHASNEWVWGLEAFWISYIAAYPAFPLGTWPRWDRRIPLSGQFIEGWLSQEKTDDFGGDDYDHDGDDYDDDDGKSDGDMDVEHSMRTESISSNIQELMWSKFCQLIAHHLPDVSVVS
ncbi:hypothetical protein FRC03_000713 [Tulasnella sp. 419]|nr:hypothetical protein FRC03_000713 [Tulasnella sp. 419]